MRKTTLATLVTAAMMSMNASALDLLQAYKEALSFDSQFASATLQRDAGRERAVQGRAGLLPQIGASANINEINASANPTPASFLKNYRSEAYQLSLQQPLFRIANYEA